jgi:outer membrane protein assembly factor BamB/tetratricopeptide (TPR) repeat protein
MRMTNRKRGLAAGLLALVLLPWLAPQLPAQDDFDEPTLAGSALFPSGDRQFRRTLTQAKEAFDEKRYDDAINLLGPLLTGNQRPGDDQPVLTEDYFLPGGRGTMSSLKGEALKLLDTLPPQAMRQYELQYGAEAQRLLSEGIKQGNADALAEAMRRYSHTEAGMKASLALGRLQLEMGRPLSAAALLARLIETPGAARTVEPEASLLLAAALHHAGRSEEAGERLLALKAARPDFAIPRAEMPAYETADEAIAWLENLVGQPASGDAATAFQWTLFRGSADRNGTATLTEPASLPRWRVPLVNDPNDEELVAEIARGFEQQGVPSIPGVQPLAVQQVILMRGPHRLVAVDVPTGKRIWEYPHSETRAEQLLRTTVQRGANNPRPNQLKQRVWDDAPYGQLSSDGERVYFVGDLGDSAPYGSSSRTVIDPFAVPRPNPAAARPTNRLQALSLSKQGSQVWYVPLGKEHQLSEAFFLGAPLPVNGQLYAIAEIKGEISLVVLNARDGAIEWKQQLAHVESLGVTNDPIRRLAGASPSMAEGVIVCPTTAGAIVAIDAATRRLLWGMPYSRGDRRGGLVSPYSVRSITRYGDRWLDGTALISKGRVVVTPPDSQELFCLDLMTGKPAWPPMKRDDLLFVAGVHEGTIVLVGRSRIVGIRLEDGKKAWPEIAIDPPSGRGLLDKSHYYQPMSSGKLAVIDVADGKLAHTYTTAERLGNLVSYGDDIVSLSDECLAAFPRIDRLEEKIAAALQKDPQDPWGLARRGELLMHAGEWEQALASLREAMSHPQRDPSAEGLFVEAVLALLESDYAKHQSLAEEVASLIDDPALAIRFHRLVALGREQAGERIAAFRAFMAMEEAGASEANLAGRDAGHQTRLLDLDRAWRVRSDRSLAAHLASLYEASTDDERTEIDAALVEQFRGLPSNSPGALRRFVERFGFHPQSRPARLQLAAQLIDSNNLLEAERLLHGLAEESDQHVAARSAALSARLLMNAGRFEAAAIAYDRLAERFGEREVAEGKTGRQLANEARERFELRQGRSKLSSEYPRGKAVVEREERNNQRNVAEHRRFYPLGLLQAESYGQTPPTAIYDPSQNSLRVRDSRGRDLAVLSLNRPDSRRFYSNVAGLYTARIVGHLLVVATGNEVIAIDLLRSGGDPGEAIVWRQDLTNVSEQGEITMVQTRGLANPWSAPRYIPADSNNQPVGMVSAITSAGLCFVKQRQLHCVDPLTGGTLWMRSDIPAGADLFCDDEYAFVAGHNSAEADVYRMLDGAHLGKRDIAYFANRWTACGRNLLSWSQGTGGNKLTLSDPWEKRAIWSESAPSGSRAWLPAPDEVALLTPEGKFKVRSLRGDEVKFEAQLEKEPSLQQIYVLKSQTEYLVAVAVPPSNPLTTNVQSAPGGHHTPMFTGRLYAFDANGKPLWPSPAIVSQMGLPLDQPIDQPVLLMMRNVIPRTSGESQRATTSLLCLDRRTGAVLHEDHELRALTQGYELQAEPEENAVRVAVPAQAIRIRFTDQPAPPVAPVQYDQATLPPPGSKGIGSAIIRGLLPRAEIPPILEEVEPNIDDPFDDDDPFQ